MGILYPVSSVLNEVSGKGLIPLNAPDNQFLVGNISRNVPSGDTFTKLTPTQAKQQLIYNGSTDFPPGYLTYGKPAGNMPYKASGNDVAYIGFDFLTPIIVNFGCVVIKNNGTVQATDNTTPNEATIVEELLYLQYSDDGETWNLASRMGSSNRDTGRAYDMPNASNVTIVYYLASVVVIPGINLIVAPNSSTSPYSASKDGQTLNHAAAVVPTPHRFWRIAFDSAWSYARPSPANCSRGCPNFVFWGLY